MLYYTSSISDGWTVRKFSNGEEFGILHGLSPDTVYFFKMQDRSVKGEGPMSPVLQFKTDSVTLGSSNETPLI